MATLVDLPTSEIQRDRIGVVKEYAARWNVTVVLKGANTVIGQPNGAARVASFANPGLATGGTGDVLSGVIAGLMAQGLEPAVAANCAVYLHGDAGREIALALGNTGMAASDLLPQIPPALRRLRGI
jgi:NAD(P)H-hydrate epimerase